MSFFSAVGSFFSSVGSAISSAVSAIGSALSSFATGVAAALGTLITALSPVAEAVGKFANSFLQGLGILKPNETASDLGERALQAAEQGITPEKFEKFDDYMAELREFEVDPEVSEKRNPAEKLVAGLGVGTVGVEDKCNVERGSLNGLWLLPIANAAYFTPERMQNLVMAGKLSGDIFAYLEKRLSGGEARSFEKRLELDLSGHELDELYEGLDKAKENWDDLTKQAEAKNQPTS